MSIQLNSAQKSAVEHRAGPLLIIAGAGTGKTRVITERIRWLVDQDLAIPEEILALTFTQKAAKEMEERVDVVMPYGYTEMWISTFHSFCDRVLRQEGLYIGLDSGYKLMTQAQEYVFFRSKLFEMPIGRLRPHGNPTKFIGEILKHFSRIADEDVSIKDYTKFTKSAVAKKLEKEVLADYKELAQVYKYYNELKQKESRLGFADLVPLVLKLFRERKDILQKYQKQFKYIMVDEFQDTNYAQNELVKLLASKKANITVVGDDDQAIYKFRGAAISNILDFKKSFPKYKKVVLTENYRSGQEILDAAYKLIKGNDPYRLEVTEKINKKLTRIWPEDVAGQDVDPDQIEIPGLDAEDRKGEVVRIHEIKDAEEAESVAQEILRLVKKNDHDYSDIALLVRANNHADEFIQVFKYHGIPFTFPGPKGLYNRPEIKDLLSFLRLLADYKLAGPIFSLLTMPFGTLTPREFIDLQRLAKEKKISVFELLEVLTDINVGAGSKSKSKPDPALTKLLCKKSHAWIEKLMKCFDHAFKQVKNNRTVGEVLYDFVTEIGYFEDLIAQEKPSAEWKAKNISRFFDILKRFEREADDPGVLQYMDYLEYSLEIGEDPGTEPLDMLEMDAVGIYTVHGAKGLEFPVVFMVNLVSDRFPTRRRSEVLPIPDALIKESLPEGDEHIQEERRLFYVGMTRARLKLYLTSADYYGDGIRKKRQSMYLEELGLVEESMGEREKKNTSELTYQKSNLVDENDVPADLMKSFWANLTRNLSYSQVSSYQNCPKQFYFKYFLGIPGVASQARSFGMTIHNTLKEFYENFQRFKGGFLEAPDQGLLLNIYENKWQSAGYESKNQEDQRFEAGKKMLERYFEQFYSEKEDPLWLEQSFRVNIKDFWMRGTIDRLDRVGKKLEIIDYKTGRVPSDEKRLKSDLQLPIYVLAVEGMKKEPVDSVSLLYVGGPVKLTVKVDENMKKKAVAEVSNVLKSIKKANFAPNPGMLCKFCDYKLICGAAMKS